METVREPDGEISCPLPQSVRRPYLTPLPATDVTSKAPAPALASLVMGFKLSMTLDRSETVFGVCLYIWNLCFVGY